MNSKSPLSFAVPLAWFVIALAGVVRAQDQGGGGIPNECGPETAVGDLLYLGNEPSEFMDAGAGSTTVNVYGVPTRHVRMPLVQDGMHGLARLYHATLQFDLSYAAWDGSGDDIKASIPRPILTASKLENASMVQPRPGTMPGLYLWQVKETGTFYQYGSPTDSGASPSSTAVYPDSSGGDTPSTTNPVIHASNLSGAQLWNFGDYVEVRHVDGSVARFVAINPYNQSNQQSDTLWHVDYVLDPYDNLTDYVYDADLRLTRIEFPSGLTQKFDYAPSWAWSSYDCVEVSYEQASGTTTTQLSGRTWGIVFNGTLGPAGGSHFGKRLHRIYSSSRVVLKDQATSGTPHSISTSSTVSGQVVHNFDYNSTTRLVTESQSVHTGTAFAQTLTVDSALPNRDILQTAFSTSTDRRVIRQDLLMQGAYTEFTYTSSGVRTTDLADLPIGGSLTATVVTAYLPGPVAAEQQRFEYFAPTGRVYSIIHTPSDNFFGRPRKHDSGNSGIGGHSSHVEPESITIYSIFDTSCSCQKPIEVQRRAKLDSTTEVRTTKFEYFTGTKLLKKRTELNPATLPSPPPAEISWEYTYVQAITGSQVWGAWLPDSEITPDGTYTYHYSNWLNRADATQHGRIPGTTERRITGVRIQDSLTNGSPTATTTISAYLHRNLSNQPDGMAHLGPVSGQPRKIVDGDGVVTVLEYSDDEGWLDTVKEHGATVVRTYAFNAAGNVTSMTDNATSTSWAATTAFPSQSAWGLVYETNSTSGGLLRESELYYDRFGHEAVTRRNNLDSAGNGPSKHGVSSSPRAWVEQQSIYHHNRLVETYRDRKPLDEAAGTGQFLTTLLEYHQNGRLKKTTNSNGSTSEFDFDGFGTLYRTVTKDPGGTVSVTSAKSFVNLFLEVTGTYENAGTPSTPEHLWTLITRNTAGAITEVTEPTGAVPSGYTGATGGAIHQFEIDVLGRVVQAESWAPGGGAALTKREIHYDQLSRRMWQRDEVIGFGSGDRHIAWRYQVGKASQLLTIERTGIAATTYSYNGTTGFLDTVTDGFSTGNITDYDYYANTPFVQKATRVDLEPVSGTRSTEVTYEVDPFGRVTAIKEGTSPQLAHSYAYNSLGLVDRYTDPAGKLQKFLPDAMGRIVEHVRVGSSGYIQNRATFEDFGNTDGRTRVLRYDDLSNVTITHSDFAGRPFIVQNPGGGTAPTSAGKNQAMCLYAEYDGASRIKSSYDGDGGKIDFWRDGPGRVIQRQLTTAGTRHSHYNTKDVILRDVLGRITQTNIWGSSSWASSPNHASAVAVEQFDQDSLGRTHEERYLFAAAPLNVLEVTSSFTQGNPFRDSLDYVDNLTGANSGLSAPVGLDFHHDAIGRLTQIDWNVAVGGSGAQSQLANYNWVGGLRRSRTVRYAHSGYPRGSATYSYDAYNRLTQIEDKITLTSGGTPSTVSKFDYEYDSASNLLKEKYTKVDGSAGDRFAYDDYHRLAQTWIGVDSTTMAASSDPTGFSASTMHEWLTYGLDGANNRDTTSTQSGSMSTAEVTDYDVQDSSHAQGPSNRYDAVAVGNEPTVYFEYDSRGNLRYDGRFVYRYDYLNRLQEVLAVEVDGEQAGDGEMFALVQPEAIEEAVEDIRTELPNYAERAVRESRDPVFRRRLRAHLRGGVVRVRTTSRTGGGMFRILDDADLQVVAIYGYDAFNRRIVQVVIGVESNFHVYDGWRQTVQYTLDTTNSSNKAAPTKEFVWGSQLDELISYRRRVGSAGSYSWENYFVLHGGQETAAMLVDSNGLVKERYEYDPYGRASVYVGSGTTAVASSSYGLPFLWKGIRRDQETGLLYMRHRYYSASLGRFITMDPLGVWRDQYNLGCGYAYAGNNPIVLEDPMGLQVGRPPAGYRPTPCFVCHGPEPTGLGPGFDAFMDAREAARAAERAATEAAAAAARAAAEAERAARRARSIAMGRDPEFDPDGNYCGNWLMDLPDINECGSYCCFLHDKCYARGVDRAKCDSDLGRCLARCGFWGWMAAPTYFIGVRLCGWTSFGPG